MDARKVKSAYHEAMQLYVQYQTALVSAAALTIDPSLDSFEQTFAPVTPPPSAPWWLGIVISLVSMVGTMAMGGFFTACTSLLSGSLTYLCLGLAVVPPKRLTADVKL